MFVNYMPFRCCALLGGIRYQKRKSGLLILPFWDDSDQLLFSVGGLLALTAYAVTEYLKCGTEMLREAEQRIEKCREPQGRGRES